MGSASQGDRRGGWGESAVARRTLCVDRPEARVQAENTVEAGEQIPGESSVGLI